MTPNQFPIFHDSLDDTAPPMISAGLVGHTALLETLVAEFQQGRMHHATILSGPQGIGKATLVFNFAKQVFALEGELNASEKIMAGTHQSLLHITRSFNEDTKKFRTEIVVGDIHRANHFLSRTASGGGTRIIIIDAADDLNRNAANALLKNLEEPPQKTHYFLLSHVAGRLLPTIRSRCRLINVPQLSEADVALVLSRNLGLDAGEADDLAGFAAGSVRQAMVMARYGGMDIIAALNALCADGQFSAVAAQSLAGAVSDRESEQRYMLLADIIEQRLADIARTGAMNGAGQASVTISTLHQTIQKQRAIAEAYKLDRKLETFNLLSRVHPYLR